MKGCRGYTIEEYARLKLSAPIRERCLIVLGVRCGFRISELLSLDIQDVSGEFICLKKRNTKGKIEGRVVPKHPEVDKVLKKYIGNRVSGPVFLNRYGKRLGRVSAWESLRDAHARAGISEERLATHSLRKTFAANLYSALDHNILKLQKAMGHKSLDSTIKYIGVDSEEIFEAIRKVK